jgi:Fe2+ transport system protein FeoA
MDNACEKPVCPTPNSVDACCPLSQLGTGACGRVSAVAGDIDLKRRLLEMGFCNGAAVEVVRRAPLGDPIEFKVRGYYLSLRSEQAKYVQVNVGK